MITSSENWNKWNKNNYMYDLTNNIDLKQFLIIITNKLKKINTKKKNFIW